MSKNKKKFRPTTRKNDKPVFNYTSECCNKPARKPPVERRSEDKAENKWSESGLGTWRCTGCERVCKVKRSRVKEETDGARTGNREGQEETNN